ncbi:uncharacterized protein L3040_007103 [Drepanopeziza brunnea f. sp. 'multigermtubi']|uniref:Dcp1-like decapping family protein n=1 Tax=Marssonina brunnea f. sp. multigermtubi (strain MB_m1) TaxID=1072389 RepID=K1WJJ2_MARBU|nr:Dcp1-like decapping family protein [Drepanopeziza brunnea f. sp. 'multigermtubi' MB_m1]EKD13021.1 Dcp1-like decapping family protein [Drepanopeziza brunnea f. sp. 'multigermtubi' MB_m1]KAJ5038236.1 hypothetical protein L3040_007103 [Drepanopeziza brunnea f. sp. 'multigermtubi']
MPPKTPRRSRRQNQATVPIQASDYDTEAFYNPPVPARTPAEINFSVIRRYVPALEEIVCYAPSAQLYTMPTGSWEKEANVEGTLFVCQLTPSPVTGGSRHCIVLLNRKGLENLIVESGEIQHVEIAAEGFLMLGFRPRGQSAESEMKVLGLFIQADDPPREAIAQLVREHWEEAVRERSLAGGDDGIVNLGDGFIPSREGHEGERTMGRRLSLSELFGKQ